MVEVINPKANVVDFGPEFTFPNGQKITSDEFVYAAANVTYRDINALQEFMKQKENEVDLGEKVRNALVKVAGAGHASMATTPGFWVFLEGTCSKLVDSIFTGAKFGSSLMPSGRRVPIALDQIVVPRGIHEVGEKAEKIYLETSRRNIQAYELLQERGVSKQEASKVVQYGHRGGGFGFMPLETLIYFAKLSEEDPEAMPREGREIISQLEDFVHEHGMGITYEARKAAPRTGCVNPNIFHFRNNLAHEKAEDMINISYPPVILSENHIPSKDRDERIQEYLERRKECFSTPESIKENWKSLLAELDNIVIDYNDSVSMTTFTRSPWRVWGEVKRHRTLPQTVESVYHAVDRASQIFEHYPEDLFEVAISIPPSVTKNNDALPLWIERMNNSFDTYNMLVDMGVPKSDAICVVPRGVKLGIVKHYDFYNLTTGYSSLRACQTAEPEMRSTTYFEMKLVKNSGIVPESIKSLIASKCHYTGFCPELSFQRSCKRISPVVPFYDETLHNEIQEMRHAEIELKLQR